MYNVILPVPRRIVYMTVFDFPAFRRSYAILEDIACLVRMSLSLALARRGHEDWNLLINLLIVDCFTSSQRLRLYQDGVAYIDS